MSQLLVDDSISGWRCSVGGGAGVRVQAWNTSTCVTPAASRFDDRRRAALATDLERCNAAMHHVSGRRTDVEKHLRTAGFHCFFCGWMNKWTKKRWNTQQPRVMAERCWHGARCRGSPATNHGARYILRPLCIIFTSPRLHKGARTSAASRKGKGSRTD